MNHLHLKLTVSAFDLNSLKFCFDEIIKKLETEELAIVYHDDYQYSYESFDNEILEIFDIEPDNFILENLPNL